MFREMRRIRQLLSADDTIAVLARCKNGVLSCLGDEGYPYGVPLSYVYHNGTVYFHSTREGHKMDAIKKYPKVSFAVIDEDTVVSAEYTTYFRSVIAFGEARIAVDAERQEAFTALVEKYSGDQSARAKAHEIAGCHQAEIIAVDIEHITGKEAIEYVRAKAD